MFDFTRGHLLRLLRVPHDPDPPVGGPGSLVVFRAGRNFYKLRLLRWALAQVGALAGILFSLQMLNMIEDAVTDARARSAPRATAPSVTPATTPTAPATEPAPKHRKRTDPKQRAVAAAAQFAERSPTWLFAVLRILEGIGILIYLCQIPLTYAMARLDYELRWYMVTDRSLRIRSGLSSVLETTMSFANVQQVVVTQGPLQRFLGLADVRVQSAGGGGDHKEGHGMDTSLHMGIFHGVENANHIRDVILERLRLFRASGLGDPDDASTPPAATIAPPASVSSATVAAARELLHEARALRQALS